MRFDGGEQRWVQEVTIADGLFPFEEFTFTAAGCIGRLGPTHEQLLLHYEPLPWLSDPECFSSDEGIQKFTVPKTGTYDIEVLSPGVGSATTQRGAFVSAQVDLDAGDQLRIIVGQYSAPRSGCGASAVISENLGCLLVAGAPGGRATSSSASADAVISPLSSIEDSLGGAAATYSSAYSCSAGGGAGFSGDGGKPSFPKTSIPAGSLSTTALGAQDQDGAGGFGGGGGWGSDSGAVACGGGGGYRGGSAASRYSNISTPSVAGGGGTCYALQGPLVRNLALSLHSGLTGYVKLSLVQKSQQSEEQPNV